MPRAEKKPSHAHTKEPRTKELRAAEPAPALRPLPPPRPPQRKPWFLALTIILLAVWFLFLLVLALRS